MSDGKDGPVSSLMQTGDLQGRLLLLLREEVGSEVDLLDIEVGNQRHDYLVLLARLQHPSLEVVIKLAGPEAPAACPFGRTAAFHRLVATHTAIQMPEIIAVDVSCRKWPWRYLIRTHIPGVEWAAARPQLSKEQLTSAYNQIGNAVAQLHSIRFPAFGELTTGGQVQGGASCLAALKERAGTLITSPRLRDVFFSVLSQQSTLFEGVRTASLCHDDLHGHNILFEYQQGAWRLATILDFDKAWAGHRETDLARLDLWTGMTGAAFWQAYEAIHATEPFYGRRRPVYQLLWCLEYARSTTKHVADTQKVCRELGIPAIEDFD